MKKLGIYDKYLSESLAFRDISLRKKIHPGFLSLMHGLYSPFLNEGHNSDPYQYSIYQNGCLSGFVQIGRPSKFFIQLALGPGITNTGVGKNVIELIKRRFNFPQLGWTFHKDNYPSAKMLYNLGGGISHMDGDLYKGILRFSDLYSEGNKRLENELPEIKNRYQDWNSSQYSLRKPLEDNVVQYMRHMNGENIL